MALVASRRPTLNTANPTAPLKQALTNFENILTEEQKQQYQTSSVKPDASSVLAFVAEVDGNNKNRGSRCVAPRLYTFLDATQQFTGVVDTFVSSHPTIAALVWGGVKTAVLTASNIASYFDKVTSLIMDIGKVCPTYQQFGQLYPGYVGLQQALCEYYAIIIRVCTKIIEVSRRTAMAQMLSSILNPFEAEFKAFLDDLDRAANAVQLQISLASKQAAKETARLWELETKENAEHRRLASKFRKDVRNEHAEAHQWRIWRAKREAEKMRSAIRTNLSTINHVKPWKRAVQQRVRDTAEWFQHEHAFRDWRADKHTAILWCSGTMGTGKTVFVSNIVAHLHVARNQSDIISYYFCQPGLSESLHARNILGSLACQLLETQIEHAKGDILVTLHDNSQDLDAADVVDFLISHLEAEKTYYLIIDGLDECESDDTRAVSQSLSKLCDSRLTGLRVLCSSRPELEKELFRIHKPRYKLNLTQRYTGPDMERYITTTLDQCLEVNKLKLSDPTLVLTIAEALQRGSDGMFLWARLIIEELCAKGSDNDIREALGHLPRGLSELLNQKWTRVQAMHNAREAIKVLQWCGVARRALTTEEFREVLSISPGQNSLDRGSFPHDMDRIIADCCGLVFVEEEESTVHYVHHSVRMHLFAEHGPHSGQFNEVDVDKHFGYLCMTYLDLGDFKRQVARAKQDLGPLLDPIKIGVGAVTCPSSTSNRLAQRLLRQLRLSQPLTADELERKAQEILGDSGATRMESELKKRQFQFLDYARTYWICHMTELDNISNEKMWKLFRRCVENSDVVAYRPWDTAEDQKTLGVSEWRNKTSMIQWTLAHGHNALLLYQALYHSSSLTEEMKRNIFHNATIEDRCRYVEIMTQYTKNTSETLDRTLMDAAKEGRTFMVSMLVTAGANVNAAVDGRTALQVAAKSGHLEVVERLLAAKANVNAPTARYDGRTALQAAAGDGHLEVVERLLAAKADVNAPATEWGLTALQAAAGGGHLEVVERLLAAKADVNAPAAGYDGRTALQAAAGVGHLEVVERLLAAKADVNAPAAGYDRRTALQAAAGGGHLEVVERLLAAKADVNAPATERGRTALQAAAGAGHLEVVERLLAAKADVNAPAARFDGRTALQAAAEGGYLKVVERLLAAKADVNAPATEMGLTALQAAAEGGHLEMVERLLAAKADVNAPAAGYDRRTALQAAAGVGHLEVVEKLLAAKADVNAPAAGYDGRTALQAAAGVGHLEVVERLLAAKADVNAPAARLGRTALQAAAGVGHLEVVEKLLAAKADVNAPATEGGRTALQAAAGGGHLGVVERLLAAKADVNAPATRYDRLTALQAAAGGGHLEVMERLKDAGAL